MKVLIIGAGMAGLAAANNLRASHHDVTVLEAKGQAGGRVCTDYSLGIPFDLGASWIYGTANNPIADLAAQYKIKFSPYTFYNCLFLDPTQHIIPANELTEFHHAFNEVLQKASDFARCAKNDMSLANALAVVAPPDYFLRLQQDMWNMEMDYLSLYMGAGINRLSARHWDEEEVLAGGNQLVIGGFGAIIKRLTEGCDILFNTIVSHIACQHNKVEVTTNNGVFQGDKVIVTLPLGVLKKGTVTFDPPLPDLKKNAIENLQMGVLNKIALKFPKIFWPTEYHGLYLSSSCVPAVSLFVNYTPFFQQPVLIGFMGGETAHALEKLPDRQLVTMAVDNLRQHFGNAIPLPEQSLITRWSQDPFSYGSYSYIPVGASGEDYDKLAGPINNRIFFAGEATCRKALGMTHGAYLSGLREAERIINLANL